MDEHHNANFFNFSNKKILYDERKKRFIYLSGGNKQQRRLFNKSYFKAQRPDIIGTDYKQWEQDFREGQAYLRIMLYYNKLEMNKLWRILQSNAYPYMYTIMDDYLTHSRIDNPRVMRLWTWRDSTRIVEFVREHKARAAKYGLDNGASMQRDTFEFTKEQMKQKEEELCEYFLHEMRKKPVE
ncbi:unnamed protein product [Moneuplotes crassus]|uniref:Uncharacterized protein n=2 Tax=Euplotes crassus TaxID=5936 RepID=A0AAD1XYB2_EUPCR|nr:unnamed protein product [Moneuplotes crassus]